MVYFALFISFMFIVMIQIFSYKYDKSRTHPKLHTSFLIASYALFTPFLLRLSPVWVSAEMQLCTAFVILVLDWFSFHQDMSRFSEKDICLLGNVGLGNCRRNAMFTGAMAHVADVAAVALLLKPLLSRRIDVLIMIICAIIYTLTGFVVIYNITKDGSPSDLRNVQTSIAGRSGAATDEEICAKTRLMSNAWRGGLNDIIIVLGILAAYQSFFNCSRVPCNSRFFVLEQFENIWRVESNSKWWRWATRFVSVFNVIIPTYANYVNTSAQHGAFDASDYDLPTCMNG